MLGFSWLRAYAPFGVKNQKKKVLKELMTYKQCTLFYFNSMSFTGNGGSTLTALEFLDNLYGTEIYQKKILMIHAGGWSQRMPSCTVLGKIFSLLPHGSPPYQMLDLKLALYWPFVDKIEPGVFLVCADDFLVYSLITSHEWRLPGKGFTALAHPSPIGIGRTHGVFVIKNIAEMDPMNPVVVSECLKVLQKPADERMKLHGALLKEKANDFAGGIHIDGEVVYTDSSFYFGVDIIQKLLNFKKSVGSLSCEIDAYGDFLQAVGTCATNQYIHLTSNVSQVTPNLLQMRQSVFDCLNDSDIHVLVMNASMFVHIGTMKELQHHFCQDERFQSQLSFEKDVFNSWNNWSPNENNSATQRFAPKHVERNNKRVSSTACIIHSFINSESTVGSDCFIEYCDFELPVTIHEKCILSNCQLLWDETTAHNARLTIPKNAFLHTVPITVESQTKYVTVYFSIDDNLKRSVSSCDVESLPFMGSDIGHFMEVQGLYKDDILPEKSQDISGSLPGSLHSNLSQAGQTVASKEVSLWSLKLFPAATSMTSSFVEAIRVMTSMTGNKSRNVSSAFFSLADLLTFKDVQAMLNFRRRLFDKISS